MGDGAGIAAPARGAIHRALLHRRKFAQIRVIIVIDSDRVAPEICGNSR